MSYSFTVSETSSFTVTHARHMAAKVATDLKRLQRLYGGQEPSDSRIADYEAEITAFLKAGYLDSVSYGYRRNGDWIEPSLHYTARDLANAAANDDDPGGIRPGANIAEAVFGSYLLCNDAWKNLTETEREAFRRTLPFRRSGAPKPGLNGYLTNDRIYSSGGRALDRCSVKSFR